MPRTVTKKCIVCGALIRKIERRYTKYMLEYVCKAHERYDSDVYISPHDRTEDGWNKCPLLYDGCNCAYFEGDV